MPVLSSSGSRLWNPSRKKFKKTVRIDFEIVFNQVKMYHNLVFVRTIKTKKR